MIISGTERRVQHQQGAGAEVPPVPPAPQYPERDRAVLQPKLHRELRRPALPGASPAAGHSSSLPPSLSLSSGQNNAQADSWKITSRIFFQLKTENYWK